MVRLEASFDWFVCLSKLIEDERRQRCAIRRSKPLRFVERIEPMDPMPMSSILLASTQVWRERPTTFLSLIDSYL
jgi:hypothetical protein